MTHLETLIAEYLDWQRFYVRRNLKVGALDHGGYEAELDIVAYRPAVSESQVMLVHYEPSIDAHSWAKRELRYQKKFSAGRKYIFTEVFPWLPPTTPLTQIAVFVSHPPDRHEIAGGGIVSVDELMAEIRAAVEREKVMAEKAIPEQYPLLRTLQLTHNGYYGVKVATGLT